MLEFFITPFVAFFIFAGSIFGIAEPEFGVAPRVLTVRQGGTGAATHTSGECLVGAGTDPFTTQACAAGGGGGAGNVATSTPDITGEVAVFTSDDATPATIGGDAQFIWDASINKLTALTIVGTNSVTTTNATSTRLAVTELRPTNITDYYGAACSNTNENVTDIADDGTFSCTAVDTTGTWSGNAATASALAGNPTDCTNQFADSIVANGNLGCNTVVASYMDLTNYYLSKSSPKTLTDAWTVVTKDRSLSAHFEHSVAIRDGGADILTLARG